jgi:predicted metallo-beta-lactamase superfamily hydrolase
MIMLGGPPFYLAGFKIDITQLQRGLANLASIVGTVPVTIMEHHVLRDEQWRKQTEQIYATAYKTEHSVMTAAEFAGEENFFLESKRKKLYIDFPPPKEFEKWIRDGIKEKNSIKPPI